MPSRPATGFILFTVLLDAMGFGLIVPVLPHLVAQLGGEGQAAASATFGLLQATYAGALFLFSPLMGRLSDRLGRRPVILLALAGATVDHLVAASADTIWLLFVARAFAGICGANAAAASAYIADVTTPDRRAAAFAMAGAAFGIGFVAGPAIGGLLADLGPRVPFWVAAGLTGLNLAYGLLVLPESLPKAARRPLDLSALNPLAGLLAWRRSRLVGGMLLAIFFFMLAQSAIQSTWVLFAGVQLGWGPADVGPSLAAMGTLAILGQALVTPFLIRRLGERAALLTGLGVTALFCLVLASVQQGWQLYAALALLPLVMAAGPAAQALISAGVDGTRQGVLQGTITGVTGLAAVFGPPLGAWTFGYFAAADAVPHLPGAAFILAALLALAALSVTLRALSPTPAGA